MKKIGLMTSGGDAPGMNACIRAVVKKALAVGDIELYGIHGGYDGIFRHHFVKLERSSASNIIQLGGTIIRTGRSRRFREEGGPEEAARILTQEYFDGIIVIGGNGSMAGLSELSKHWQGQLIGLPGTIDNDIFGTDLTIGYDTALNTALDGIDKIRDTAGAHRRNFVIEVMGRDAGHIAVSVAIGGGCDEAIVPEEEPVDWDALSTRMKHNMKAGKVTNILVLAEGAADKMGAYAAAQKLAELTGVKWRAVVLGYIQRGGSPSARDRMLATKLGAYAVDTFVEGVSNVMIGEINKELVRTPLEEVVNQKKGLDQYMLDILDLDT